MSLASSLGSRCCWGAPPPLFKPLRNAALTTAKRRPFIPKSPCTASWTGEVDVYLNLPREELLYSRLDAVARRAVAGFRGRHHGICWTQHGRTAHACFNTAGPEGLGFNGSTCSSWTCCATRLGSTRRLGRPTPGSVGCADLECTSDWALAAAGHRGRHPDHH